jgi:hypothetical protein
MEVTMKDKEGTTLTRGDLTMLIIDTPVDQVAGLVMFLENEEYTVQAEDDDGNEILKNVNTVLYYPITDEGLEVAKYDNGNAPATMHREKKFTVTNVEPKHLLKMDSSNLRDYQKTLFTNISAEL